MYLLAFNPDIDAYGSPYTRKSSFVRIDYDGAGLDASFQYSQVVAFYEVQTFTERVNVALIIPCAKSPAHHRAINDQGIDTLTGLQVIQHDQQMLANREVCISIEYITGKVIVAEPPTEINDIPRYYKWVIQILE